MKRRRHALVELSSSSDFDDFDDDFAPTKLKPKGVSIVLKKKGSPKKKASVSINKGRGRPAKKKAKSCDSEGVKNKNRPGDNTKIKLKTRISKTKKHTDDVRLSDGLESDNSLLLAYGSSKSWQSSVVSKKKPLDDSLLELSKKKPLDDSLLEISKKKPLDDSLLELSKQKPLDDSLLELSKKKPLDDSLLELSKKKPLDDSLLVLPVRKKRRPRKGTDCKESSVVVDTSVNLDSSAKANTNPKVDASAKVDTTSTTKADTIPGDNSDFPDPDVVKVTDKTSNQSSDNSVNIETENMGITGDPATAVSCEDISSKVSCEDMSSKEEPGTPSTPGSSKRKRSSSSSLGYSFCQICKKNISGYSPAKRCSHVNKCCDDMERINNFGNNNSTASTGTSKHPPKDSDSSTGASKHPPKKSDKSKIPCPLCPKIYAQKASLKRHLVACCQANEKSFETVVEECLGQSNAAEKKKERSREKKKPVPALILDNGLALSKAQNIILDIVTDKGFRDDIPNTPALKASKLTTYRSKRNSIWNIAGTSESELKTVLNHDNSLINTQRRNRIQEPDCDHDALPATQSICLDKSSLPSQSEITQSVTQFLKELGNNTPLKERLSQLMYSPDKQPIQITNSFKTKPGTSSLATFQDSPAPPSPANSLGDLLPSPVKVEPDMSSDMSALVVITPDVMTPDVIITPDVLTLDVIITPDIVTPSTDTDDLELPKMIDMDPIIESCPKEVNQTTDRSPNPSDISEVGKSSIRSPTRNSSLEEEDHCQDLDPFVPSSLRGEDLADDSNLDLFQSSINEDDGDRSLLNVSPITDIGHTDPSIIHIDDATITVDDSPISPSRDMSPSASRDVTSPHNRDVTPPRDVTSPITDVGRDTSPGYFAVECTEQSDERRETAVTRSEDAGECNEAAGECASSPNTGLSPAYRQKVCSSTTHDSVSQIPNTSYSESAVQVECPTRSKSTCTHTATRSQGTCTAGSSTQATSTEVPPSRTVATHMEFVTVATTTQEIGSSSTETQTLGINPLRDFALRLKNDLTTCDVTLCCTDNAVKRAHRLFLNMSCPKLLDPKDMKSSVDLGLSSNAADYFLEYVYTQQIENVDIEPRLLEELTDIAFRLDMTELAIHLNSKEAATIKIEFQQSCGSRLLLTLSSQDLHNLSQELVDKTMSQSSFSERPSQDFVQGSPLIFLKDASPHSFSDKFLADERSSVTGLCVEENSGFPAKDPDCSSNLSHNISNLSFPPDEVPFPMHDLSQPCDFSFSCRNEDDGFNDSSLRENFSTEAPPSNPEGSNQGNHDIQSNHGNHDNGITVENVSDDSDALPSSGVQGTSEPPNHEEKTSTQQMEEQEKKVTQEKQDAEFIDMIKSLDDTVLSTPLSFIDSLSPIKLSPSSTTISISDSSFTVTPLTTKGIDDNKPGPSGVKSKRAQKNKSTPKSSKKSVSRSVSRKRPVPKPVSRLVDELGFSSFSDPGTPVQDLSVYQKTPGFKEMGTPRLKEEIDKVGLKQLTKKKAIVKLEEIHRFTNKKYLKCPDDEGTAESLKDKSKRKPDPASKAKRKKRLSTEISGSDTGCPVGDISLSLKESKSCRAKVKQEITELIKGNQELHIAILQYEPVDVLFIKGLMERQTSVGLIAEILDKEGITYINSATQGRKGSQKPGSQKPRPRKKAGTSSQAS